MLIRESIEKTKNYFQKTLHNLKSFCFVGYQKLQKPHLLKPFCIGKPRNHETDQYYTDFCNEWESDLDEVKMMKSSSTTIVASTKEMTKNKEDECRENLMKFTKKSSLIKSTQEVEKKKMKGGGGEGYALAQKMKQLDMMDSGDDVEHVLDVEEALHYYSRLKSPVYLDIVDKFFVDMYSEFSVPQASASINNSKHRLRSIRL